MRARRPATVDEPVQEYNSVDQLRRSNGVPSGRFAVSMDGGLVDFRLQSQQADTLIVTYHGATLSDVSLPWFTGSGVTSETGASWLAVSDPSLHYGNGLTLGWYAGCRNKPRLQSHVAAVVEEVAIKRGVQHLIFMGVSGGGFAALETSIRFPGSVALVGNPQTAIKNYIPKQVQRYIDTAWDGQSPLVNDSSVRVVHDLNKAFTTADNTVAYLQNSRDAFHISMHLLPFFRNNAETGRAWLLMDAWGAPGGDGHIPPPKTLMADALNQLTASQGEWATTLTELGFDPQVDPSTLRERAAAANEAAEKHPQSQK